MMKTVRVHYSDFSLANMIQSALKVSSTENISKRMELEFFRNWLVVSRKTPNEIFKSLELENAGSTLFTNPFLDTWIQYMTAFNKLKPRDKTDMIETFLRYFGEGNLLQMIKTGKKIPKTEKVALDMERCCFGVGLFIEGTNKPTAQ
ncbi:hypothetical protein GQ600_9308 [Phytophthora cactorum]|nr:hypothetical protein GQ600_9308 [Phytophthora cactorum]